MLKISCGCAIDTGFWLCHTELPILAFYSRVNRIIEDFVFIPYDGSCNIRNAYSGIQYADGMLYLAPYNANSIMIYDIRLRKFNWIMLKDVEGFNNQLFSNVYVLDEEVLFFPFNYRYVLKINRKNSSVTYVEVPKFVLDKNDFIVKSIRKGSNIIGILSNEYAFIQYSIIDEKWKKIKLNDRGNKKSGFSRFIFLDEKCYVLNHIENKIECFRYDNFEKIYELDLCIAFGCDIEVDGVFIFDLDNENILLNIVKSGERIICDKKLFVVAKYNEIENKIFLGSSYIFGIKDFAGSSYLFEELRVGIYCKTNNRIIFEKLYYNPKLLAEITKGYMKYNSGLIENKYFALSDYITSMSYL